MSDSLVGETLCFEGKNCFVYPNLFLCLFVCSGVQEVVVGYYSLVSFGFYPKEDPVVDLLAGKAFCFGGNSFADSHFSQRGCNSHLFVFVDNNVC